MSPFLCPTSVVLQPPLMPADAPFSEFPLTPLFPLKKARSSRLSYVCGSAKTPLWQTQNCPGYCFSDSRSTEVNSRLSSDSRSMEGKLKCALHKAIIFFKSQVTYKFNSTLFFTGPLPKSKLLLALPGLPRWHWCS